jgi:hypothetical protein
VYESTEGRPSSNQAEAEPNNTASGADAQAALTASGAVVGGTLGSATDVDLFRLVLTEPRLVTAETFDATAGDCPAADHDTRLRVLAADGTTAVANDDDSGIAFCDALTTHLAAGTYYIELGHNGGSGPIANYRLAVSAADSAVPEPEIATPANDNDALQRATQLPVLAALALVS